MEIDNPIKSFYDRPNEFLHLVDSRLFEIENEKDDFKKSLEKGVICSAIDYAMKRWSTRKRDEEYEKYIDELLNICHKHGFTPLYEITGSEDILPETIRYSPNKSILFGSNGSSLYLIMTGDMRCFATFSAKGCSIVDYKISQNLRYLSILFDIGIYTWDLSELKLDSIVDIKKTAFCVMDDGDILYSDKNQLLSRSDETPLFDYPYTIDNMIILNQKTILLTGCISAIVNLDGIITGVYLSLSKDSRAFIKDDFIYVLSGCSLYVLSLEGELVKKEDYSSNMYLPLSVKNNITITKMEPSHYGNGLSISATLRDGSLCIIDYNRNSKGELSFSGYEIHDWHFSEEYHIINLIRVLETYHKNWPYLEIEPYEQLESRDDCFAIQDRKCHYYKVVQRGEDYLKIIRAEVDLKTYWYSKAVLDYDVMMKYVNKEDIDRFNKHASNPDNFEWLYVNSDPFSDEIAVYYHNSDMVIHCDNEPTYLCNLNINWTYAQDCDSEYAILSYDSGLMVISNGKATFIDGATYKQNTFPVFNKSDGCYRIHADHSVEYLGNIPSGFEIVSMSEKKVLFRNNDKLILAPGGEIFTVESNNSLILLDGENITLYELICPNANSIMYIEDDNNNASVRIVNLRDKTEKEHDLLNNNGYECIGTHKNLRFDLGKIEFAESGTTIKLAEIRPDTMAFREKTGLDLSCNYYFKKNRYRTRTDAIVAILDENVVTVNRDDDNIALQRYKIGKTVDDTNNVLKTSISRFYNKNISLSDDGKTCFVYTTGSSNDDTDRKYRGRSSPEVRLIDTMTGKRNKNLLRGFQGYKIGINPKSLMLRNSKYLLAECVSNSTNEKHVSLWKCINGERYPSDAPVHGAIVDTDDNNIYLFEKSDETGCLGHSVTYDYEMNEINRKQADISPDVDYLYQYKLNTKDYKLPLRNNYCAFEGDVFYKCTSVSEIEDNGSVFVPVLNSISKDYKRFRVKLNLYTLKHCVMSDETAVEITLLSQSKNEKDINEAISNSLAFSAFDGRYLMEGLVSESVHQVREEMNIQLTVIEKESVEIKKVKNPFVRDKVEHHQVAYIGNDGLAYIEADTGMLVLSGKMNKKIDVPKEYQHSSVVYGDDDFVLLYTIDKKLVHCDWDVFKEITTAIDYRDLFSLRPVRTGTSRLIFADSYSLFEFDSDNCELKAIKRNEDKEALEVIKGVYVSN